MNENFKVPFQTNPSALAPGQHRLHHVQATFRPNTETPTWNQHTTVHIFCLNVWQRAVCPSANVYKLIELAVLYSFFCTPTITDLNSTSQHSWKYLLYFFASPPTILNRAQCGNSQIPGWPFVVGLPSGYLPSFGGWWLVSQMNAAFRTKIEQRDKRELKDLKLG